MIAAIVAKTSEPVATSRPVASNRRPHMPPKPRLLRHFRLAHTVLGIGLLISLAAWLSSAFFFERQAQTEFDSKAQVLVADIERRSQRYVDLLYGLQGLFGDDLSITRAEFRRYVAALDLARRLPGVQAIEFVQYVLHADREEFEASIRVDRGLDKRGYPAFAILPQGSRPEYLVINYVEPMQGNESAFGRDILTRDESMEATTRARDTGMPISTGRYQRFQDHIDQPGLVVYLPIYRSRLAIRTPQQRKSDFVGLVNIVVRLDDLFANLADADDHQTIAMQVFDVGASNADPQAPDARNLLFSTSRDRLDTASRTLQQSTIPLSIAGRRWLVHFSRPAEYGGVAQLRPQTLMILLGALTITGLLFFSLRTLSQSREAAMKMARTATRELRDQLSFSQQLIETLPHPVFYKDAAGRYLGCNQAFEVFSNRKREEYIGRTVLEVTTSEAARTHDEVETVLLREHGSKTYELSITRTTDGRRIDAIYNKATFVDADGNVAGLVGVALDITERKALERTLSESNERLRSLIEGSPLAIIARDLAGVVSLWNPAAERLFGWHADEVVGKAHSIVPPDMRGEVNAMRQRVEQGMTFTFEETRRIRKDGVVIDVALSVGPTYDANHRIVGTMVLIADINRRKQAELALRESEAQLRLAMDAADMASWYWDLNTKKITYSDGFGPLFGLLRGQFYPDYEAFKGAIHPDDRALAVAAIRQALKHDLHFELECRILWPDQSIHWLAVRGQVTRDTAMRAERIIGVANDTTVRKHAEQHIAFLAHHDTLTGLPNRALLQDRIARAIAFSHRNDTKVAVLFIDLDHFKTINDSLGHLLGDALLRLVAERILGCLRDLDTVARLGGDEFVVVIPELAQGSDVNMVAVKLLETLATHFHLQGHDLHVSASVGISIYPADGTDAETLMRNADTAMYHAKARGRSQYQFFTSEMNVAAQQKMSLQMALHRSLQSNGFILHYQPVIHAAEQRLDGFEALLRWRGDDGALVPPGEFIAVAEDSGLIVAIGEWVIREACKTAAAWHRHGYKFKIAINISAIQLQRKYFADFVKAAVAVTGADPTLIEFEITERVIIGAHDEVIEALRQLDLLGIHIAIDDFGTGYSGLSYLKQFSIDTVKIDQSFVRNLTIAADDAAIVRAIIAMSKSLGLNVVAEGVEHVAQSNMLTELGCDHLQGYYFSRPIPADEVNAYIDAATTGRIRRTA